MIMIMMMMTIVMVIKHSDKYNIYWGGYQNLNLIIREIISSDNYCLSLPFGSVIIHTSAHTPAILHVACRKVCYSAICPLRCAFRLTRVHTHNTNVRQCVVEISTIYKYMKNFPATGSILYSNRRIIRHLLSVSI